MRVPYEIIESAIVKDDHALQYVNDHFDSYLNYLARREKFDAKGNVIKYVDQEVKETIRLALLVAIPEFKIKEV